MPRFQSTRSPLPAIILAFLVVAAFVLLSAPSLNDTFWLDDSWTANSAREPRLIGMLYYQGWMQHTAPLFLFALRWGAAWSDREWVWRLLPWLGSLAAAGLLWRFLKRELGHWWALAGLTLLLFTESVMQQAVAIRSYSWETAIGVILLTAGVDSFRRPSPGAFSRLYCSACLLVLTGYSAPVQVAAASVLPAWAVWLRRSRPEFRRLLQALIAGAGVSALLFASVYFMMLAPNIGPSLKAYWFSGSQTALTEQLATVLSLSPGSRIAAMAPVASLVVYFAFLPVLLLVLRRAGVRDWMRNAPVVAAWAMLAAAAAAHLLRAVPLSPRGGVYLAPWCIVALLMTLRMASRFSRTSLRETEWRRLGFTLLAILVSGAFVSTYTRLSRRDTGREDFRALVGDLRAGLRPGDRLIVHPTTREQFKYYSRMTGFDPADIVWGDTAWPCCVPNKLPFQAASEERLAAEALPPALPRPKRIFLTVLAYDWFWEACGADERPRWRSALAARGCAFDETKAYGRADLMSFSCEGRDAPRP